jgi:hypothetical protein
MHIAAMLKFLGLNCDITLYLFLLVFWPYFVFGQNHLYVKML